MDKIPAFVSVNVHPATEYSNECTCIIRNTMAIINPSCGMYFKPVDWFYYTTNKYYC